MIQILGIVILVLGLLLILFGILRSSKSITPDGVQSKTSGIILIGPIPIIFGSSRKTQILLCLFGIIAALILLVLFQLWLIQPQTGHWLIPSIVLTILPFKRHSGQIPRLSSQTGHFVRLAKSLKHEIVPHEWHFIAWSAQNSFLHLSQRSFAFSLHNVQERTKSCHHNSGI